MKKYIIVVLVISFGILGFSMLNRGGPDTSKDAPRSAATNNKSEDEKSQQPLNFVKVPQNSAHHVSNTPEHASILKSAPENVSITFNLDLIKSSDIKITSVYTGKDASEGAVSFSSDNKTMQKSVSSALGNGLYSVLYTACTADGACEMGSFQFGIQN